MPDTPSPLPGRTRVALLGFSALERQAMEGYFRLSATPGAGFEPVPSLAEADCCVVDADHPLALRDAQEGGWAGVSVFIGTQAPPDAVTHLPRPVDVQAVTRALHALVQRRRTVSRVLRDPTVAIEHFGIDVLVADDCDIARRYLQVQLERHGCRVTLARNGLEALERAQQQPPRLVFADADMPDLDGLSLCRHLKTKGGAVPSVAIITGLCSAATRARAHLVGCDAFLVKPLTRPVLLAVLRTQAG